MHSVLSIDPTPHISRDITVKVKIERPVAPSIGAFQPHWFWEVVGSVSSNSKEPDQISKLDVASSTKLSNDPSYLVTGDTPPNCFDDLTRPELAGLQILDSAAPWQAVLSTPCDFEPGHFIHVLDNQLRNPNLTTSFLFRADILYDSARDKAAFDNPGDSGSLVKWMKKEYQPRGITSLPKGFKVKRTVVRKLVPRKPWVDPEIAQTVHFLDNESSSAQKAVEEKGSLMRKQINIVVYIPHVDSVDSVPFYHPKVQALALTHSYSTHATPAASLLISYQFFTSQMEAQNDMTASLEGADGGQRAKRLQRTALNFLKIVHKHGTGTKAGYQKRVHHDQIVPQKRFQDTYTRLKEKYSQGLMDAWAEVTDPQKHVYEDLGIASFLIEVWRDMYELPKADEYETEQQDGKPPFPGFVDVGCGNGILVHILLSEGYAGWGFDARKRKSWEVLSVEAQKHLHEGIFIPKPLMDHVNVEDIINSRIPAGELGENDKGAMEPEHQVRGIKNVGNFKIHDGIFRPGTFIISNHADQLTAWTPLMAYMSDCPFISIPCCSHSLSGKLQRFYDDPPGLEEDIAGNGSSIDDERLEASGCAKPKMAFKLKQAALEEMDGFANHGYEEQLLQDATIGLSRNKPEKGSLGPRKAGPSAYAGFTAHVMHLALDLGFQVRQEVLRIPSTRNLCVLGTKPLASPRSSSSSQQTNGAETPNPKAKEQEIAEILQKEVGSDVSKAARYWVEGALGLTKAGKTSVKGAFGKSSADHEINENHGELHEERTRRKHKMLGIQSLDELDLIE